MKAFIWYQQIPAEVFSKQSYKQVSYLKSGSSAWYAAAFSL